MKENKPPDACLRLPARMSSIPPLREMALEIAARAELDGQLIQRLDLVLEEALMNVIHHAYSDEKESGEGDMELSCRAENSGRVCLTLRDWGRPFDPLHEEDTLLEAQMAANLDADLDSRAPGGLGLFLIRTMSEASYKREAEANVLFFCIGP